MQLHGRKPYTLDIRRCISIDLVASQCHKVWLLLVKNSLNKFQGSWISVAMVTLGFRVSASAEPSAEMQVGYLHDLVFAILPDLRDGSFNLGCTTSPYTEAGLSALLALLEV
jgi:hypothetical protein